MPRDTKIDNTETAIKKIDIVKETILFNEYIYIFKILEKRRPF